MTIARKVSEFLADTGVDYDVVEHERTESTSRTAQAAHVKGDHVIKTVVIHDGKRYLLGVVPSTHRVELDTLGTVLDKRLTLATEGEAARLFEDCALGADPPIGSAYGLPVIVDETIFDQDEVYFEGGDHQSLVRVTNDGFNKLMQDAIKARFSHHI